jgi:hypothetical protein
MLQVLTIMDVINTTRVHDLLPCDSGACHCANAHAELCHGAVELGTTIQAHAAVGQLMG